MSNQYKNVDAFSEAITRELKRHNEEETIDVSITWGPANSFQAHTTWSAYYFNPISAMERRVAQLEEELAKEKAKLADHQAKENKK